MELWCGALPHSQNSFAYIQEVSLGMVNSHKMYSLSFKVSYNKTPFFYFFSKNGTTFFNIYVLR